MCWDWKRGGFQMMLPSRWGAIIHNRDIWQWLVASCKRREHRFVENPWGVPLWKWSTLDSPHFFWLVVDLPLWKNMKVSGMIIPYMKWKMASLGFPCQVSNCDTSFWYMKWKRKAMFENSRVSQKGPLGEFLAGSAIGGRRKGHPTMNEFLPFVGTFAKCLAKK